MPNGANVSARVAERIRASEHTLTVVFPFTRPIITGTGPSAAPTNPLFGTTPPVPTIGPDTGTPEAAPTTMPCLWLESLNQSSAAMQAATLGKLGWHAEADAVARVLLTDAQYSLTTGMTLFDACDHVEHGGRHYVVLQVTPIGTTFAKPTTCSVWLRTARKQ